MAALDYCKGQGRSLCVGITNVVGSEVSRETECGTHVKAGSPAGRGVASTKAYTSQFLAMAMFGTLLGYDSRHKVERRQGWMVRVVVKELKGCSSELWLTNTASMQQCRDQRLYDC